MDNSTTPPPLCLDPHDLDVFTNQQRVYTNKLIHATTRDAWQSIDSSRLCKGSISQDQSYDCLASPRARSRAFAFFLVNTDTAMFPFSSYPKNLEVGSKVKICAIPINILLDESLTMFYVGSTPTQFGGRAYKSGCRSHVTLVRERDIAFAKSEWVPMDKHSNGILRFNVDNEALVSTKISVNGRSLPHSVAVSFLNGVDVSGADISAVDGIKLSLSMPESRCPLPGCSTRIQSFSSLKAHYLAVKHVSPLHTFKCKDCDKEYLQESQLQRHVASNHTEAKSHQCRECHASFSHISSLRQHSSFVHSTERRHSCTLCEKSYVSRQDLARHTRSVHEGIRRHQCTQCEMAFAQDCELSRHISAVHELSKPHECPECDMKFSLRGNMRKHIASVHSTAKEHVCRECNKSFSLRENLKLHINSLHRRSEQHLCSRCDKSFSNRSNLLRHIIRIHHGGLLC